MTPEQFIARWKDNSLSEKSGAQAHFEDLCKLLNVDPPRESDEYCYEQGLKKMHGGIGFADVWKRGCFAWENKGPDKDLSAALMQLKNYSGALDNPPVLVVCNRERIELHPCFTGYPSTPTIIMLDDIGQPSNLQKLRWLFSAEDVVKLRPVKSNAAITAEAAGEFAKIAFSMRQRGLDSQQAAHFLIQCIFCMYAEDEAILHQGRTDNPGIFTAILKSAVGDPERAKSRIERLFNAMRSGGVYGNDDIAWFNGGLFNVIDIPHLLPEEIIILRDAAEKMDWRAIDPTIFGTLFERGLDPSARAPLGAHYTDVETIQKLIRPLIIEPLTTEWLLVKERLQASFKQGVSTKAGKAAHTKANKTYLRFLERLRNFRILDPACGSGNFLYLAMHALKDIEHTAQTDAEILGFGRQITIETGPANILGIEINEYAAELARVTVWIGDIQWSTKNGRQIAKNPILRTLSGIVNRDAILNDDGSEPNWPDADVIVGNPPFLGGFKKRSELGDQYFEALSACYSDRVPSGADLVCYWFEKARRQISEGKTKTAGLVATNSIRQQANRKVLDRIIKTTKIFNAWSDIAWVNDGAAVRVSLVCFGDREKSYLEGKEVSVIHSNLTTGNNLTSAKRLSGNVNASFFGLALAGPFTIDEETAERWLLLPNPNGKPNSDVIRQLWNGQDLTGRWNGRWVIDFGPTMDEKEASLYEAPFQHVVKHVKPIRAENNRKSRAEKWWRHGEPRPAMRRALEPLSRYIVTSEKSKHRYFAWLDKGIAPDNRLIVISREDDATFGVLSSRLHVTWALAVGSTLEDRPAYATNTCFDTFPFPDGLSPADTRGDTTEYGGVIIPSTANDYTKKIAEAAFRLNQLRESWLNPSAWVIRTPPIVAGYPEKISPVNGHESDLKKRTLTNLYNTKPAWLEMAHKDLDQAVAAAYGWNDYTPDMSDDEILKRLLALNLERASSQ